LRRSRGARHVRFHRDGPRLDPLSFPPDREIPVPRTLQYPSILLLGFGVGLAACDGPSVDGALDRDAPLVAAVEVLRIGSIDDPDEAFTYPSALAVTEDGRLISGHRQDPEVRVWSEDGDFLGTMGRAGEGPGEFQAVGSIRVEEDTVWVLDSRASRFHAFHAGTFEALRSVTLPFGETRWDDRLVRPYARLGPGRYLGNPSAPSSQVASGEIVDRAILILDENATPLDTLPRVPFGNGGWAVEPEPGRGGLYMRQPYGDAMHIEVVADGAHYLLDPRVDPAGDYAPVLLHRRSLSGDTLWTRELDFEVVPVDPDVRDSIAEVRVPDVPAFSRRRDAMIEAARRSLYLPPFEPGARSMLVDDAERVWIRSSMTEDGLDIWWLVDATGELVARVQVPSSLNPIAAHGDRLLGVEVGEFDVPFIVAYEAEVGG